MVWSEVTLKTAAAGVALLTSLVTTGVGAYNWHIDTFAKQEDITMISARLEQKILTDRMFSIQQRMWRIEDRYGVDLAEAPPIVKEEYRSLRKELSALEREIDRVQEIYKQLQNVEPNAYYDRAPGK